MKSADRIREEKRPPLRIIPSAKRFLLLLLGLILSIGANGCMKKRNIPEEMLEHMRNKYNEEFTLVSTDIQSWMADHRTMLVEPAAFPGERVQVRREKTGEITDGYLALKVNAEVEKEISAAAFEVYGENKVFNLAQTSANSYYTLPDMSASEFLKIKPGITNASIWVTKDPSEKDKDVEAFRQVLKVKGYYLTFYIVYIEEEAFPSLNKENENKYYVDYVSRAETPVMMAGSFMIDKTFEFDFAEWR